MIEAGTYHNLKVNRISDFGLYLANEEGDEVLLPNRYVSLNDKVGDSLEVFVYHDSEDRLVATTEKPLATVGEAAFLEVVDKTVHGAFLNWGLTAKDLFMPNRNMVGHVTPGRKYVVYLYRDNITGRAVATMSFKGHIANENLTVKRGDRVNILVAQEVPSGYRAIIDNRHWGMLYRDQLFGEIHIGDRGPAYIRKVTADNRIDLSLQQEGYDEVKTSAERLLGLIRRNNGFLALNDDSTPEQIRDTVHMSKKVFKRSAGYLMKRGDIKMDETGIKLTK